jgi:hypothetical protein
MICLFSLLAVRVRRLYCLDMEGTQDTKKFNPFLQNAETLTMRWPETLQTTTGLVMMRGQHPRRQAAEDNVELLCQLFTEDQLSPLSLGLPLGQFLSEVQVHTH